MSLLPTQFMGLPVVDYDPTAPPPIPSVALRVSSRSYETEDGYDAFMHLVAQPFSKHVTALVLANRTSRLPKALLEHRGAFSSLRGLILNASSGPQPDTVATLNAFPGLEHLRLVTHEVVTTPFRHISLRRLAMESWGIEKTTIVSLSNSVIPDLECLELMGNVVEVESLANLVRHPPFGKLKQLKIRRQSGLERVMVALVESPLAHQLETLDLSAVSFTDRAAQTLLTARAKFAHLNKLVLRFHSLTPRMEKRIRKLGIEVLLGYSDLAR